MRLFMTGLELNINKKIISASLPNGGVHVIIDVIQNKSNIILTGLDMISGRHFDWYKKELNVGDELSLKVINSNVSSIPEEVREGMSKEEVNQAKDQDLSLFFKEEEMLVEILTLFFVGINIVT